MYFAIVAIDGDAVTLHGADGSVETLSLEGLVDDVGLSVGTAGELNLVDGMWSLDDRFEVVDASIEVAGPPNATRLTLQPFGRSVSFEDIGLIDGQRRIADRLRSSVFLCAHPDSGRALADGRIGWWRVTAADFAALSNPPARGPEWRTPNLPDSVPGEVFINPYTFVPFPADDAFSRTSPVGHRRLGDTRLMGRIDIEWELVSPLLVRTGRAELHGSSMKGAIRARHEALVGGCLRVADLGFVPGYRDAMAVGAERQTGWKLARVTEVEGQRDTADVCGRPKAVAICSEVVWVPIDDFLPADADRTDLRTGAYIRISAPKVKVAHGRSELVAGDGTAVQVVKDPADATHVVLISSRPSVAKQPYHFAAGAIGEFGAAVTDEAWRTYLNAARGADDIRKPPSDGAKFTVVKYQERRIGERRTVRLGLHVGDVIWVRTNDRKQVEQIALSAIWRHSGARPAEERIPPGLKPCTDAGNLCPTCAMFGMADANATALGAQQSYRGHLRFTTALPVPGADVGLVEVELPPMGSPRPGAGQFYLRTNEPRGRNGARPHREWGSDPDDGAARRFRGRKFYWPAVPTETTRDGSPQARKTGILRSSADGRGVAGKLVDHSWTIPAGAKLRSSVVFENLTEAELGGLVAAIDPNLVLRGAHPRAASDGGSLRMVIHLGGGKPLGYGIVAPNCSVAVEDAGSRYLGAPPPDVSLVSAVEAFRASVPEAIQATWPALAAVSCADSVNPGLVWYPPGAGWSEMGSTAFERGYAFWAVTAGRDVDLVDFPDPTVPNPTFPIVAR